MATPLVQPLTRAIQIGETVYHVTMHPDRVAIRQKGRRSSVEVSWTELLAFEQRMQEPVAPAATPEGKPRAVSRGILNEVAQQLRTATEFLSKADDTLTQAGALPAALVCPPNLVQPDSLYAELEKRAVATTGSRPGCWWRLGYMGR